MAITGHRSDKISDPAWVTSAIASSLQFLGATKMIQGMAHGVDLYSAVAANSVGVPYVAARPYAGHTAGYQHQKAYQWALEHASEVKVLNDSTQYPGAWIMHARNHWMVDHADMLLAVWDGSTTGGTFETVRYAIKNSVDIYRIDPILKEVGWYRQYVLPEQGVDEEETSG